MSLLLKNSTPAERKRGIVFSELFVSNQKVAENGGTITGSPSINFGAVLDGTGDYIKYDAHGIFVNNANISIVIEFTPDFDSTDDENYYLMDSSFESRYFVLKLKNSNANVLNIWLGNSTIVNIANATYAPFWKVNERNVLVISGTSGATDVWLNGSQILTADNTAWTPKDPAKLFIGSSNDVNSNNFKFDGTIHSLKIFNQLLTAQEAQDIYDNTIYSYRNRAILDLPMGAENHDPTNNRTLDVSKSGAHATLGAGDGGATTPTKLVKRGYSTDGGDYIETGNIVTSLPRITMVCAFRLGSLSGTVSPMEYTQSNNDIGGLFLYVEALDNFRFYCGGVSSNQASYFDLSSPDSPPLIIVIGVHDGIDTKIYINGVKGINALEPLPPLVDATSIISLFRRRGGSATPSGTEIYEAQMYDFAFTPMQVHDVTARILKQLNKI